MVCFEVCKANVPQSDEMCKFFYTLHAGIQYLQSVTDICASPLYNPLPNVCVPQSDIYGVRFLAFHLK